MYSKFMFLFFIRYVRNRIDHWCTVKPGNPNLRVHRSSGKLGEASFPTGTVDPRVGISLSPLNTNDGFSLPPAGPAGSCPLHLPHVQSMFSDRDAKYWCCILELKANQCFVCNFLKCA